MGLVEGLADLAGVDVEAAADAEVGQASDVGGDAGGGHGAGQVEVVVDGAGVGLDKQGDDEVLGAQEGALEQVAGAGAAAEGVMPVIGSGVRGSVVVMWWRLSVRRGGSAVG